MYLILMGELMAFYWILEKLTMSGIILCMRPANEQQCYNATSSLIGWAHTQNDPCRLQWDGTAPLYRQDLLSSESEMWLTLFLSSTRLNLFFNSQRYIKLKILSTKTVILTHWCLQGHRWFRWWHGAYQLDEIRPSQSALDGALFHFTHGRDMQCLLWALLWKIITLSSFDIRCTLVGNKIIDHSDEVRASPVSAAPTTPLNTWLQWIEQRQLQDKNRNMYRQTS